MRPHRRAERASFGTAIVFSVLLQLMLVLPDMGRETARGALPLLPIAMALFGAALRRLRWKHAIFLVGGVVGVYGAAVCVLSGSASARTAMVYLHWLRVPFMVDLKRPGSSRGLQGVRNVELTAADGAKIYGWHFLPPAEAAGAPYLWPSGRHSEEEVAAFYDGALSRAKLSFLMLHGNAGTRALQYRVSKAKELAAAFGAHVLAIDYRGFGDCEGTPSEEGLVADALGAFRWLAERSGEGAPIVVHGNSLGTGVAVQVGSRVAAAEGAEGHKLRDRLRGGIILEAPFTSLRAVAIVHPLASAFRLLPPVRRLLLRVLPDEWNTQRTLRAGGLAGKTRILVLHGQRDSDIPPFMGAAVAQAAREGGVDVTHVGMSAADHDNQHRYGDWLPSIAAFLQAGGACEAAAGDGAACGIE